MTPTRLQPPAPTPVTVEAATAAAPHQLAPRARPGGAASALRAALLPGAAEPGRFPGTGHPRWRAVLPYLLGIYGLTGPVWILLFVTPRDRGMAVGLLVVAAVVVSAAWRPLAAWRLGTAALVVLHLGQRVAGPYPDMSDQLDLVSIALWVPLLFLAARTSSGARLAAVCLVSALAWLVITASSLTPLSPAGVGLSALLSAAALLAGALGGTREGSAEEVAEANRRAQTAREAQVVLAERARIAREMHDVVAHHLSMLAVRAETAPYRLGGVDGAAGDELAALAAGAREGLQQMRGLLTVLRTSGEGQGGDLREPAAVQDRPAPGLGELQELMEQARAAGTELRWHVEVPVAVPDALALTTYRIVAQALSNCRQHAAGAPVSVWVATGTLDSPTVSSPASSPASSPGSSAPSAPSSCVRPSPSVPQSMAGHPPQVSPQAEPRSAGRDAASAGAGVWAQVGSRHGLRPTPTAAPPAVSGDTCNLTPAGGSVSPAASPASVVTGAGHAALHIEVLNGPGHDHGPGAGLGVVLLRERVGVHAGTLTATPLPDGGFALRAVLPLPTSTAAAVTVTSGRTEGVSQHER